MRPCPRLSSFGRPSLGAGGGRSIGVTGARVKIAQALVAEGAFELATAIALLRGGSLRRPVGNAATLTRRDRAALDRAIARPTAVAARAGGRGAVRTLLPGILRDRDADNDQEKQ